MSEELSMKDKLDMVRDAKPSYARDTFVKEWNDTGKLINAERRQEARKELVQSALFEKTVGTRLNLHDPTKKLAGGDAAAVTITGGAFHALYEQSGATFLQGGTVTGANGGTGTIADYEVVASGDTPPLAKTGQILYVKASCEVTVEDGVMLPGIKLATGSAPTIHFGFALPPNHSFTTTASTGDLHYEIGRWTDDKFLPSGVGSLLVTGCIGNYYITRL